MKYVNALRYITEKQGLPMAKPDARPLYEQVRELLFGRIQDGTWTPGMVLPNEFQLADELGVSQGTVRKALGALTSDKLLVRRQGRGTFVAAHTPADVLFRFFQFYDRDGNWVIPASRERRTRSGKAKIAEVKQLGIDRSERVIRHSRIRTVDDEPTIIELIVLPETLFKGLGDKSEVPNTLYDLFQKEYGITVGQAVERLTVIQADKTQAKSLGINSGAPLLRIDRLTYAIDGRPIEWRVSVCDLRDLHYRVNLS
ncbi:MAG: GntR family transcriptional regulator [Hyphomicrobiaceae bacterium TMED74]|nr:MAG: GntR family transcriptional regulator [Hyphomicrobiaceae bacterium TMED74]